MTHRLPVTLNRWNLRALSVAVGTAFGVKLALATLTFGTNDMLSWESFWEKISTAGGLQLYRDVPLFNHPPFMIHLLKTWGLADGFFHIPLAFSLRMTSVLADLGTAWLMWKLAALRGLSVRQGPILIAVMSPISILVAGFHGNTDPLMMFFTVAAVYAAECGGSPWLVGLLLGAAMNIKVVPVLLIPALLFWLDGLRKRAEFVTAVALTFFAGSMPYLVQDPKLILARVFGYGSLQGQWGWSLLPRILAQNLGLSEWFTILATRERVCLLLGILVLAVWMNRRGTKPRPFLQCGFVLFVFLAASPGWGVQYLDWLVVWTLALSVPAAAIFHLVGGVFLFFTYHFWAGGFPWYLADSTKFGRRPWQVILLGQVIWVVIVLLAPRFYDLIQRNRRLSESAVSPQTVLAAVSGSTPADGTSPVA